MGTVNDKYIMQIEHSVLLNSNPNEDYKMDGNSITINPKSYSKPEIKKADKQLILNELAEELRHYGLSVIDMDAKTIKIKADDFELDVPKKLVLPYDDAMFGTILKYHQDHFSNRAR